MSSNYLKKLVVNEKSTIKFALNKLKISGTRCLVVIDNKKRFLGTCSDGDIRKKILNGYTLYNKITNVYNKKPYFIYKDTYSFYEVEKKINNGIDLIPVLSKNHQCIDIILKSNLKKYNSHKLKLKKNLSAIIMAGGLGKRLRPFTNILPKSLLPLNGKPIIELIIEILRKNGFKEIFISINKRDLILKSFFDKKKIKGIKFIEENNPLGPLGALSKLRRNRNNIFVTNCDTFFNFDINKLIENHNSSESMCTIVVSKNTEKSKYGHCILDLKNKNLLDIKEKPKYSYILNVGIYILSKDVLKYFKKNRYSTILDLIKILRENKCNINTFFIRKGSWIDAGNWEDLSKVKNNTVLPNIKI